MTTDPMDLPDPAEMKQATARNLLTELLDTIDGSMNRCRQQAQGDADARTNSANWGLIALVQSDTETWRYIASRAAELYVQTVIQPTLGRIRTSTMAICDLADMMAEAAAEAEDKK